MSGSDGPRGLDRGIAALRWLLVSAQDDDSARAQVLPALSRCTVLLPTMTGASDKLRFIAQPSGGNAMVVFTGHDALEHAAKKLGWAQGTESVRFRAMSAREALETASLQGTRAVIVDAAAEHALELRYDEVSMYLSRGTAEFAPDFVEPSSRGTGEYGTPQRKSPVPSVRGTGDYGQPQRKTNAPGAAKATGEFSPRGTGDRNVADLREEVAAPRKARDARRDDDDKGGGLRARIDRAMAASEPLSERIDRAMGGPEAAKERGPSRAPPARPQASARDQVTQPIPKKRQSSGSVKAAARKRNLAEIDDPFISSTPRQAPVGAGSAGGQARRVPSLSAPPLSREMPSSPFESSRPPSSPTDEQQPPPMSPMAKRMAAFNYERDQTIPLEDISTAQAARDSAARVSADRVTTPAAKPEPGVPIDMFGRPASEPVDRPAVATHAVVNISSPERAPLVHAAPAAPAPAKEPEPEPRPTGTVPKPSATRTQPPPALEAAADLQDPSLGEVVLSAIAEELRKFPEAEWACVLPEEAAHVIGVRVDPSYLERTRDIEAAVANVARKQGALVQPVIVSTPAATKDARARGLMFFPWKKKK